MFSKKFNNLTIKNLLEEKQTKLITVDELMTVRDVTITFAENNISGAPVVDGDNNLAGVISLSDVSRSEAIIDLKGVLELIFFNASADVKSEVEEHLRENYSELTASEIMTPNPITVELNDKLKSAIKIMLDNKIHRLIVTDKGKLTGIITTTDVLNLVLTNCSD